MAILLAEGNALTMPFVPVETRTQIIRPALQAVDLWSDAAENLLLVTGAQESGYAFIQQIGGGPALGFWQMEPATHDDCWANYIEYRRPLLHALWDVAGTADLVDGSGGEMPNSDLLMTNPQYACAMARVKYLRSTLPLPEANDAAGMWAIYKAVYNTAAGAATEAEFMNAWDRWVSSNPIS